MANGPMPLDQALDLWNESGFTPQVRLGAYPTEEWVNLKCLKCDRKGRLSKARLLAEHGPNKGLVDLINTLRPDNCPHNTRTVEGFNPCGICYADLKHPRFP